MREIVHVIIKFPSLSLMLNCFETNNCDYICQVNVALRNNGEIAGQTGSSF